MNKLESNFDTTCQPRLVGFLCEILAYHQDVKLQTCSLSQGSVARGTNATFPIALYLPLNHDSAEHLGQHHVLSRKPQQLVCSTSTLQNLYPFVTHSRPSGQGERRAHVRLLFPCSFFLHAIDPSCVVLVVAYTSPPCFLRWNFRCGVHRVVPKSAQQRHARHHFGHAPEPRQKHVLVGWPRGPTCQG